MLVRFLSLLSSVLLRRCFVPCCKANKTRPFQRVIVWIQSEKDALLDSRSSSRIRQFVPVPSLGKGSVSPYHQSSPFHPTIGVAREDEERKARTFQGLFVHCVRRGRFAPRPAMFLATSGSVSMVDLRGEGPPLHQLSLPLRFRFFPLCAAAHLGPVPVKQPIYIHHQNKVSSCQPLILQCGRCD